MKRLQVSNMGRQKLRQESSVARAKSRQSSRGFSTGYSVSNGASIVNLNGGRVQLRSQGTLSGSVSVEGDRALGNVGL